MGVSNFGLSNLARCPFVVAVDTREQIPFSFVGMQMPIKGKMQEVHVETIERCLGNNGGDYCVEGIDDVRVERKSLEDAYSTLAKREAFLEQISWMNFAFRFSAVVIEASWDEVCDPSKFTTPLEWKTSAGWIESYHADGRIFQIEDDYIGTYTATEDKVIIYQGSRLRDAIDACERRNVDETWRSQLNPQSVTQTILSWSQKFPRVHWCCPGGRRQAEEYTFGILRHAWRHSKERKK